MSVITGRITSFCYKVPIMLRIEAIGPGLCFYRFEFTLDSDVKAYEVLNSDDRASGVLR